MKRQLTSAELSSLRLTLFDGGSALSDSPLGRSQRGGGFSFDPFGAYDAGLVTNPNVLVTGAIGVGKSTFVKMLLSRGLARGRRAVVLDPKGEYGDLARSVGGTVIELGTPDGQWCSPFTGDHRDDVVLVESLIAAARSRSLGDDERFILDTTWRTLNASTSARPLEQLFNSFAPHLAEQLNSAEKELALTLRRFVLGDLVGLFDGTETPHTAHGSLVVLDLSASWTTDTFALTALAAMAIARRVLSGLEPGYLVIDEAWAVLVEPRVAHWLHGSWKLARARATSHVLVLHRWSDAFATADLGSAQRTKTTGILRDCDSVMLFRQDPGELQLLNDVLRLHELEAHYVTALARGVMLARYGPHRSVVHLEPNSRDRAIIDTDRAMRLSTS